MAGGVAAEGLAVATVSLRGRVHVRDSLAMEGVLVLPRAEAAMV